VRPGQQIDGCMRLEPTAPCIDACGPLRTFMSWLIPHASEMSSAEALPIPNTLASAMWKFELSGSTVRAITSPVAIANQA
jgi:hypothetical protein